MPPLAGRLSGRYFVFEVGPKSNAPPRGKWANYRGGPCGEEDVMGRITKMIWPWLLAALVVGPPLLRAQDAPKPFSKEELEQIVAPIALYPDALVAQILMASTYPLE